MKARFSNWSALALGLALAAPAMAKPPHAQRPPAHAQAKRAELQQKLREVRSRLLREQVGLDEKTALAAEKILDKYLVEREKLETAQREEKKRLRAMLDLDQNDQAAYTKSLRALLDVQQKLARLRQQEFDELAKVLSPKQQAKLARVIDEAMTKLRKKLRHKGDD